MGTAAKKQTVEADEKVIVTVPPSTDYQVIEVYPRRRCCLCITADLTVRISNPVTVSLDQAPLIADISTNPNGKS